MSLNLIFDLVGLAKMAANVFRFFVFTIYMIALFATIIKVETSEMIVSGTNDGEDKEPVQASQRFTR